MTYFLSYCTIHTPLPEHHVDIRHWQALTDHKCDRASQVLDQNIVQYCLGSMFSQERTTPVPLKGNAHDFFTFYLFIFFLFMASFNLSNVVFQSMSGFKL